MRILFVCTGNTCRSPLAEVIMKHEAAKAGLRDVVISSAGLSAMDGGPASENARLAARELGLSLSRFRSKPLTRRRAKLADIILTMTKRQKREIVRRWPEAGPKTSLISEFSRSGRKGIDDPLGGSLNDYRECAKKLSDEARRIVRRLLRQKWKRTRSRAHKK